MNCEEKDLMGYFDSKGHCQGQKGPVWLIFTYFSILISSIEVLPKCIASCSFAEVILVLSQIVMVLIDLKGYFQGQEGPIWTFVIYLGQYLRNGACCDQYVYEAHIHSLIIMIFQLTL